MASDTPINALNLLGQTVSSPESVHLAGTTEPQLSIGWGEYRQSLASCLATLFSRSAISPGLLHENFFRDSWIERRVPRRAILAAALWHIAFIVLPFPFLLLMPKRNPALANSQLTWTGPIEDLPLLDIPAAKPVAKTPDTNTNTPPARGADAFHPRQRIFTDPVHPNHPRQTLINPTAPQIAPQLTANLPNMVELAQMQGPARPKIEISSKMLHPKQRQAVVQSAVAPTLSNTELHPADLSIAANPDQPARPKLEINAGSAPRVEQGNRTADAGPAPEVATSTPSGAPSTFIALSSTPGPPAPVVERPQGNLAAKVSISPDGPRPGNAGAANAHGGGTGGSSASGTSPVGVSISGGNPSSATSGLSAVKPKLTLPSSRSIYARPAADPSDDPPARTDPPNFAALPPGAKPEQIFGGKQVYSLNINMPNVNSATGSWIVNFSELGTNAGHHPVANEDLVAPVALRKVDPKYPQNLMAENVEGEVILYAVIRSDGSVDSIEVVRGVDEQLDANAMHAFSEWKFRPAEKNGKPIALEAIVHIPFRLPSFQ
jgi:TonB family protein